MVKKRKLPPHIVLPNGQWRFIKAGKSRTKKVKSERVIKTARRKSYRKSGNGMGKLTSQKNIIGTLGGAYIAQKFLGMSPQIGAAIGSYAYGKAGIVGAAAGYVVAPMAMSLVGNVTGSVTTTGEWK